MPADAPLPKIAARTRPAIVREGSGLWPPVKTIASMLRLAFFL